MMVRRAVGVGVAIVAALFLFVTACTPEPPAEAVQPAPEPAPVETSVAVVAEPAALTDGLVTFLVGDAFHQNGTPEWYPLDIGDPVPVDSTVRVDDNSYVDIQFGTFAAIRLEPRTTVSISQLSIKPGERRATIELVAGTVLNNVEELTGTDRYRVRTASTVAGVRGTAFGVTATDDGRTVVGVKTGRVSVAPRAVSEIEDLVDDVDDDEVLVGLVESIVRSFDEGAILTDEQQFVVDEPIAAELERQVAAVAEAVRTLVLEPAQPVEQRQAAREDVQRRGEQAIAARPDPTPVQTVSPEVREQLRRIDDLRLLPDPPAPRARPDATPDASAQEAPVAESARLSVRVQPDTATVYADAVAVGGVRFSGVYSIGTVVAIEAYADGYEPFIEEVTIGEPGLTELHVAMVALPEPETVVEPVAAAAVPDTEPVAEPEPSRYRVNVRTTPANASILLDGRPVGRGSFTGEYEAGTRLSLDASLSGYEPDQRVVTVGERPVDVSIVLSRVQRSITVNATPAGAEIFLAGRRVGTGTYTGTHSVGDSLRFEVRAPGYDTESFSLSVTEDSPTTRGVALRQSRRPIVVESATPGAEIFLDGRRVAAGRYTGSHEIGENLQFEVRAPGYVARGTTVVVGTETPERHTIALERERRTITVTAQPSDAAILLDGRRVGAGRYETTAPIDQTLRFRVERDGYAPADLTVDLARSTETSYTVALEPRPIERRITASNAPLVRTVAVEGETFIVSDRSGAVTAASAGGAIRWNAATRNTPNENSPPVVAFGRVYISGSAEFVVLDLANGSVVTSEALGADSAHIFGRRVVTGAERLYYPTNRGFDVVDQSGTRTESIVITGGSSMTPAVSGNRIVIANQSGVVFVLDAASNAVVAEIPTDAAQPVALAPAISDGVAYIAGRRGNIVAVDIGAGAVRWQIDLDPDRSMGSYVDPVTSAESVFFFARDTIYALRRANGARAFAPISGVSGAPLVSDGSLVYGTATGMLVIADAATGRSRAEIEIGARVTTRPALWNGRYVVGLENGEIVIVNPVGVIR